jgi:hypothetical protein
MSSTRHAEPEQLEPVAEAREGGGSAGVGAGRGSNIISNPYVGAARRRGRSPVPVRSGRLTRQGHLLGIILRSATAGVKAGKLCLDVEDDCGRVGPCELMLPPKSTHVSGSKQQTITSATSRTSSRRAASGRRRWRPTSRRCRARLGLAFVGATSRCRPSPSSASRCSGRGTYSPPPGCRPECPQSRRRRLQSHREATAGASDKLHPLVIRDAVGERELRLNQ